MGGPSKNQSSSIDSDYDQDDSSIPLLNKYNYNIPYIYYEFLSYNNLNINQSLSYNRQNQETENAIKNIILSNNNDNSDEDTIEDDNLYFHKNFEKINEEEEIIPSQKLEEKIFNIIKLSKKRGRRSNSYKEKHKDVKYVHDKTSNDNITRKIKIRLTNSLLDFVNKVYTKKYKELHKDSKEIQNSKKWLYDISEKSKTTISRDENLNWLDMTVKDYLSSDVSTKNKNYEIGHNAKEIKKVCDEGKMVELIEILNMKIREVLNHYVTNGIVRLDVSLVTLRIDFNKEYENDEKYFLQIKEVANNFETNFLKKKTRRK